VVIAHHQGVDAHLVEGVEHDATLGEIAFRSSLKEVARVNMDDPGSLAFGGHESGERRETVHTAVKVGRVENDNPKGSRRALGRRRRRGLRARDDKERCETDSFESPLHLASL
ncbi:MAG TPA: hypothetical protein VFC86_01425, partial [Planctomycetota bacterium]|nr:hypothetical protein [Planctomycetota bacterium]